MLKQRLGRVLFVGVRLSWRHAFKTGAPTVTQVVHQPGAHAAGVRDTLREDILRQLQQAASLEALQRARQAAERAAQQRLEAELAGGRVFVDVVCGGRCQEYMRRLTRGWG